MTKRDLKITFFVVLPISVLIAAFIFELIVDRRLEVDKWMIETSDGDNLRPFHDPPWSNHKLTKGYFVLSDGHKGRRERREITYHFDRFGFRSGGGDKDYERPIDIALIGDSYTFADETPFEDTLHAKLKNRYPDLNIVNWGMCGSSSTYYDDTARLMLSRIDQPIKNLVVGLYVDMRIGDVPRALAVERYGERAYYKGIHVGASTQRQIRESWFGELRFNFERTVRSWSTIVNLLFPKKFDPNFNIDLEKEGLGTADFDAYETRILKNLEELARATSLPKNKIAVWFVPSGHELVKIFDAKERGGEVAEFYKRSFAFWDRMAKSLERAGYLVIDPRDDFEELFLEKKVYPYTASGHFKGEGFEIVTEKLSPYINEWYAADPITKVQDTITKQ